MAIASHQILRQRRGASRTAFLALCIFFLSDAALHHQKSSSRSSEMGRSADKAGQGVRGKKTRCTQMHNLHTRKSGKLSSLCGRSSHAQSAIIETSSSPNKADLCGEFFCFFFLTFSAALAIRRVVVEEASKKAKGRVAQLVRALALQAGGHRFETCSAHNKKIFWDGS